MHQVRFLAEGDRGEGAYKRGKGRGGLAPKRKKKQTSPTVVRFVIGVSVVTGLTGQTAGASHVWNDAVDAAAASAAHIDSTATCSSVPRDHRCAARHSDTDSARTAQKSGR